jgi:hypothetical protein
MFDRSALNDPFLYHRLDCCCPTSGQPGRGYCEYDGGGIHHSSRRAEETGESCARPRLGAKDPDHLLKIVQDLDQVLKREEQVPMILGEP